MPKRCWLLLCLVFVLFTACGTQRYGHLKKVNRLHHQPALHPMAAMPAMMPAIPVDLPEQRPIGVTWKLPAGVHPGFVTTTVLKPLRRACDRYVVEQREGQYGLALFIFLVYFFFVVLMVLLILGIVFNAKWVWLPAGIILMIFLLLIL